MPSSSTLGHRSLVLTPAAVIAAVLLLPAACGGPAPEGESSAVPAPVSTGDEIFVDRAAAAGVDFVHFNGMSGELYFAEMAGGGAAVFDYDGDGDQDLYLVQGTMLPPEAPISKALIPPRHPLPLTDRLYRNDSTPEAGLRFTDVTADAGALSAGYGMGVASGDFDNDGRVDLYVYNLGPNALLRNRGDGSFEDVTAAAGVDDPRWTNTALFFDYDRDGWLDLYVGNYVDFTVASHKVCLDDAGAPDYCGPLAYRPLTDRLLRNRGDGSFEDVTAAAGPGSRPGATLGAVAADFDGDGWLDLYLANDQMSNELWLNQRDGTFREEGLLGGAALSGDGQPQASMGVDAADFDGDGDEDLFISHLSRETNTLYLNDGNAVFEDATTRSGLAAPSWEYTGFGTAWFDYDNDGWLDLLVVNGAVSLLEAQVRAGEVLPLRQSDQLYHNLGGGRFEEVASPGVALSTPTVSRGAAFGDLDDDGDLDVVVADNGGPVRLLENRVGARAPWLGLQLVERHGREALGARVGLRRADGTTLWRRVGTAGSYASARDPRLVFGLGTGAAPERVEVQWPDGSRESWPAPPSGRYTTLRQGSGEALP